MNRLFREEAGVWQVPYPEVDTVWERLRSGFVFWIKKQNRQ